MPHDPRCARVGGSTAGFEHVRWDPASPGVGFGLGGDALAGGADGVSR